MTDSKSIACPDPRELARLLSDPSPSSSNDVAQAGDDEPVPNAVTSRESIESHLSDCETCQRRLEQLSVLDAMTLPAASALHDSRHSGSLVRLVASLKQQGATPRRPANAEIVARLLEPSDDPETLGMLGKYRVLEVLGQGGMGIVVKAIDPSLDRVVAIKILRPDLAATDSERQRFVREAKAAGSIHHPNVVTIYSVDESANPPYLVMEHVDGETLTSRLRREEMTTVELCELARDILRGLEAAHEKNLIHRDIKPANILLGSPRGVAKISDFGIAKAINESNPLTVVGAVAGTPEFMSPEQATARLPLDARSDLFSLGALLYLAASGESPFRAASTFATMKRICEESPEPLASVCETVPVWFASIVDRLLEKSPAQRFQSTTEVLQAIQSPDHVVVKRETRTRLPRSLWIATTAAVVILVFVAMATKFLPRSTAGTATGFSLEDGQSFASLQDAIAAATSGQTILVHGSDRLQIEGVSIEGKELSIHAAAGSTPILVSAATNDRPAFISDSTLSLKGLRLQWSSDAPRTLDLMHAAVVLRDADLRLSDCELACDGLTAIASTGAVHARGTEFDCVEGAGIVLGTGSETQHEIKSCNFVGRAGLVLLASNHQSASTLSIEDCRFETESAIQLVRDRSSGSRVDILARSNDFLATQCVYAQSGVPAYVDANRAAAQFQQFRWIVDENNIFAADKPRLQIARRRGGIAFEIHHQDDWRDFWQLQ
ncbi:MAG: serine/threonine-protein kinase [Planctomycetota bacterium]